MSLVLASIVYSGLTFLWNVSETHTREVEVVTAGIVLEQGGPCHNLSTSFYEGKSDWSAIKSISYRLC